LSKLIVAVWTFFNSTLSELEQISLSASSTLKSSSAIFGGREENPCWNPSADRTSQLMEGPRVAINVEQVSSCLSFLCSSSLQRENMTSHISELLCDAAISIAIELKLNASGNNRHKMVVLLHAVGDKEEVHNSSIRCGTHLHSVDYKL
jgi:hypothetical protein